MVVELLVARCLFFRSLSSVAAQVHGPFGVVLDRHSASVADQGRFYWALVFGLVAKRHGGVGSIVGHCQHGFPLERR